MEEVNRKLVIEVDEKSAVKVRFPARSMEAAHEAIESLRAEPPEGYKMTYSSTTPRAKSGRRVNVKLKFDWVDDRIPAFDHAEAKSWFSDIALEATRG